jgi:hypothetical protein
MIDQAAGIFAPYVEPRLSHAPVDFEEERELLP